MSEKIEVQRLSGHGFSVYDVVKEPFLAGGACPKYLVEGVSGRSNKFSLVERYDPGNDYEKSWRLYKEIGLPVVPTLRRGKNGNIFITDIKWDGSEVYGKSLGYSLGGYGKRYRPRPQMDKIFVDLISSDIYNQVKDRVSECVDIATNNDILLPQDDTFDLLVHPDGSWDIILLDVGDGRWILGHEAVTDVRAANLERAMVFTDHLEELNKILQTH